jgi:hypothetical protein
MQLLSRTFGWSFLVAFSVVQSAWAFTPAPLQKAKSPIANTALGVASVEIPSVSDMQRGVGGRIEDAFAAAKEKGEAAFVTFVTAGFPASEGASE